MYPHTNATLHARVRKRASVQQRASFSTSGHCSRVPQRRTLLIVYHTQYESGVFFRRKDCGFVNKKKFITPNIGRKQSTRECQINTFTICRRNCHESVPNNNSILQKRGELLINQKLYRFQQDFSAKGFFFKNCQPRYAVQCCFVFFSIKKKREINKR